VTVLEAAADDGVSDWIRGGGLTVSEAELPLAKPVPAVVWPEIETRYGVAVVTPTDAGTTNVTRRVVPGMATTLDAGVETVGPAPAVAGCSVTVVSAAAIVPDGKPVPVMASVVTPAWPAAGVAVAANVTLVWARTAVEAIRTRSARTRQRLRVRGIVVEVVVKQEVAEAEGSAQIALENT
jgi:hypothetical protein